MPIFLFLITIIVLLGCKPDVETAVVTDCDNTFVVSGGEHFFLLAYDKTADKIRMAQHYEGEQRYQSSYICELDIVLSTYQFRGSAKEDAGFEVVYRDGKAEQVEFADGPVAFVSYQDGILVGTNRLHAEPVDESLGDSPYLIRDRERGYSYREDNKEVFLYTHYIPFSRMDKKDFNPDRSIRFSAPLGDSAGIYDDILLAPETVTPETGLYRVNLITGRRTRVSKVAGSLNDIHVSGNGDRYYLLWPATQHYMAAIKGREHLFKRPPPLPGDPEEARLQAYYRGMVRDTLYRFEEDPKSGEWTYTKLKKIDGGIYHYLAVGEVIYIFTRDQRAILYDSVKDAWQEFPFEYSDRFERINAIGDGLVFTLKSRDGGLARVYVVSRDFSRISKPLTIDRNWSEMQISTRYNFISPRPKWLVR